MAARKDVFNITRGFWMKRSQAVRAVESEFVMAWEDEAHTLVRSLTLQESYDARIAHAAKREYIQAPLARHELPGFLFQPPASGTLAYRESRRLAWQANQFAAQAA